jgi:hypothetical protein
MPRNNMEEGAQTMKNPLDLKQYTGDYINTTVFRTLVFTIILLLLYTFNAAGWDFTPVKTYHCPENQYNQSCIIKEGCEESIEWSNNCTPTKTIILSAGSSTEPREQVPAVKGFGANLAAMVAAAFVANHVLWLYRRKKL